MKDETTHATPVIVDATELARAVKIAARATDKKSKIPCLQCVGLSPSGGSVEVSGTDCERLTTVDVPASSAEWPGGWTTADALALSKALQGTSGEVSLTPVTGGGLEMKFSLSAAQIRVDGVPPEDMPLVSIDMENAASLSVPAPEMARTLAAVAPAMSKDATRSYLNGAYFTRGCDVDPDSLVVVATDGHRLVRVNTARAIEAWGGRNVEASRQCGVIAPRTWVEDALSVCKARENRNETVTLTLCADAVRLKVGTATLVSKCVNGVFPDYERIIPRQTGGPTMTDARSLESATEAVVALSQDRARPVVLSRSDEELTVKTPAGEDRSTSRVLPARGAGIETVAFNGKYLLDVLKAFPGKGAEVSVYQENEGAPALIESPDALEITAVLMPFRAE